MAVFEFYVELIANEKVEPFYGYLQELKKYYGDDVGLQNLYA